MDKIGIGAADLAPLVERRVGEVDRRSRRYHGDRGPPALEDRTVILVDDGIATGSTARAALRAIQEHRPKRLILAVPVASARALEALRNEVDEVVALRVDPYLAPIGAYYLQFRRLADEDVVALLERARRRTHDAAA